MQQFYGDEFAKFIVISVNTKINNNYVYSLYRHVSARMSYFHAVTRTIFVYKVTVLILGSQRLHVFYIDVIYCITIEGCNKCHC